MPKRNNRKKASTAKKRSTPKQSRQERYITKLAEDLRKFREREEAGEVISAKERKNIRARERRVMVRMRKESAPLISEANRVMSLMQENGIRTLEMQRIYDDWAKIGHAEFTLDDSQSYTDIVKEINRASSFLNDPESNVLTASREIRNRALQDRYSSQLESLRNEGYVKSGLIPTEDDAKKIFANYRRIEEFYSARIGKQGQKGVYGSENLILYMIDVHNKGLDEYQYGIEALENFNQEQLPEFEELIKERNKVTGISGLFQKGGLYGKLEGLL